jgi:hypothetical protein
MTPEEFAACLHEDFLRDNMPWEGWKDRDLTFFAEGGYDVHIRVLDFTDERVLIEYGEIDENDNFAPEKDEDGVAVQSWVDRDAINMEYGLVSVPGGLLPSLAPDARTDSDEEKEALAERLEDEISARIGLTEQKETLAARREKVREGLSDVMLTLEGLRLEKGLILFVDIGDCLVDRLNGNIAKYDPAVREHALRNFGIDEAEFTTRLSWQVGFLDTYEERMTPQEFLLLSEQGRLRTENKDFNSN